MSSRHSVRRDFTLSGTDIDELVGEVFAYLEHQFADKAERLRIRLSVEELLLDWRDFLGQDATVTLDCRRRLGRPSVRLSAKGPRYRKNVDNADPSLTDKLMAEMALCPRTRYAAGANVTTYYLPRRPIGVGVRVLIAAVLGVLVGAAAKAALPAQTCAYISSAYLSPVFETILGIISMLAGPLIYLCAFCGICGSASAESFRRVGRISLIGNFAWALVALVASFVVAVPLFGMGVAAAQGAGSGPSEVVSLLLGIIPGNLVEPFEKGNTLQTIVIAVAFGMVALKLGDGAAHIVRLANEAKELLSSLIGWTVVLLPLLVFLTVVQNILGDTAESLLGCWLPFVATIALVALLMCARVAYSARRMGRSLVEVARAVAPATLVAFATASSATVFPEMLNTCKKHLGVPSEMADVCVPLGVILARYTNVVELVIGPCFFAMQYGVDTSPAWYVVFAVSAFLMSFALPPIPGGALAVVNGLFLQLGLPTEAIAMGMVLDVIVDFFTTAATVAAAQVHAGEIATCCARADKQGS